MTTSRAIAGVSSDEAEVRDEAGRDGAIRSRRVVVVELRESVPRIVHVEQGCVVQVGDALTDEGIAHMMDDLTLNRVVGLPQHDDEPTQTHLLPQGPARRLEDL